jgi:hypothetical protein
VFLGWFSGVSRALVAEGLGQGVAQLLVVGLELSDPLVGQLKALFEGGVAGGLPGWGRCSRRWPVVLDLGEQVGLGVQPGPGHARLLRDGGDGEGLVGSRELA